MTEVRIARTRQDLATARAELAGTVALVPTMGALHEGHRCLLRKAKESADAVVVSIFVNPLQFGPNEDLDRYPQTLEADLQMCAAEGVALAFVPTREVVYPREPAVRVCAGSIGDRLEGASRPGHFDGVLTVVAKLFALTKPDLAVFGRKDAQQLALVRRMVADLDLGVRIVEAPLVRDVDGLALSSRNKYLSQQQRAAALILPSALATAADAARNGATPGQLLTIARSLIGSADGVELDYVALVDPDTFDDVRDASSDREAVLAVAARVGNTRLIDNVGVTVRSGSAAHEAHEAQEAQEG